MVNSFRKALLFFGLFGVVVHANPVDKDWHQLINSNGWQISFPKCWSAFGWKQSAELSSPQVNIRSTDRDSKCSSKFKDLGEVQVSTPLGIRKSDFVKNGEVEIEHLTRSGFPTLKILNPTALKDAFAFVHYQRASGDPKLPFDRLFWRVFSTCGDLNINLSLSYKVSAEEAKIPIEERKLSDIQARILRSLKCNRQ